MSLYGGPRNKDFGSWGSILGSSVLGKYPLSPAPTVCGFGLVFRARIMQSSG